MTGSCCWAVSHCALPTARQPKTTATLRSGAQAALRGVTYATILLVTVATVFALAGTTFALVRVSRRSSLWAIYDSGDVVSGSGPGATLPTTRTSPLRVACLGDSLTRGSCSTRGGYPVELQRLLGSAFNVSGYGESGRTALRRGVCGPDSPLDESSSGDCSIWDTDTFKRALASEPDVVTIMLGTNDAKASRITVTLYAM